MSEQARREATIEIATAIAAFFARRDWPVSRFNDDTDSAASDRAYSDVDRDTENVSITSVKGVNGAWPVVVALVGPGPSHLVVQSIIPCTAPLGAEVPVIELLARLNDGLVDGCFELNLDDGTIRLRSSVPVMWLAGIGADRIEQLVDVLVTNNVMVADRLLPAFAAVIEHGIAPGLAVVAVEADLDPLTFG